MLKSLVIGAIALAIGFTASPGAVRADGRDLAKGVFLGAVIGGAIANKRSRSVDRRFRGEPYDEQFYSRDRRDRRDRVRSRDRAFDNRNFGNRGGFRSNQGGFRNNARSGRDRDYYERPRHNRFSRYDSRRRDFFDR